MFHLKLDCGVMINASHKNKEYDSMKLSRFLGADLRGFEKQVANGELPALNW